MSNPTVRITHNVAAELSELFITNSGRTELKLLVFTFHHFLSYYFTSLHPPLISYSTLSHLSHSSQSLALSRCQHNNYASQRTAQTVQPSRVTLPHAFVLNCKILTKFTRWWGNFFLLSRPVPLPYRLENKRNNFFSILKFQVHKITPTICLHAYKLNGSRSTNTNNTIRTGTHSFVVSVRHGLSTETKDKKRIRL
jgi:hypothetical protein